MELAKIDTNGLLDLRYCDNSLGAKITELRNAGFLDFVSSEQPQCNPGEIAVDSFTIEGGKVIQHWEIQREL